MKVILWDVDGTLLDFHAAEKQALKTSMETFGLPSPDDEMIARYSAINKKYWEALERGEMTKQQILEGRFCEFFRTEGLGCPDAAAFNDNYQMELGETICFVDNAYTLLSELKGQVKQYAVTNGTYVAQSRKLKKSGLDQIFDGLFISDLIGAEKPSSEFFDYVFQNIGEYEKEEILIVGDSLTSDIQGGNNAGIRSCWYTPKGGRLPDYLQADIITNLWQVKSFL